MKAIFFKKIVSLLSVIRGYNILVLIAAQYLAAIFIFSNSKNVTNVISDTHLLFLVLATVCVVASGYIINNFYDDKADKINRPIKSNIDSYVGQKTKLNLYFMLNFTGAGLALLVSTRAFLFYSVYIFGIWLYSHKLKKHPILGLLSATMLTILPFFVVLVHYKNFSKVIFIHASFLGLVVAVRELIKGLENMKGAIINNYNTFTVAYGETKTKHLIILLLLLTLIPIGFLYNYQAIEYMKYYFYLAGIVLIFVGFFVQKAETKNQYRWLHNLLKILLLIGVVSLLFVDKSLILDKVVSVLG